ncbi:MAG: hypothetical protein NWR72_19585 [Bacteroidia bacterium]|nr:hypothetical protein [Bacteroidia bacterium]
MRKASLLALLLGMLIFVLPAQDQVVIGTIAIQGAEKTRHQVILNEMTLLTGDTVLLSEVPAALERSRNNIYNLGLFNEVTIQEIRLKEMLHLIIEVKERVYIIGAPYLQVEERNSYDLVNALLNLDFHRLVYGASLQWRNMTGRNETLTFFGQLGFSQRFSIDFNRPTLSRNRLDYRTGIRYVNQHEVIIGTEQGKAQWRRVESEPLETSWQVYAGAKQRLGLYKTLYAELRYDRYHYSDSLYSFSLEGGPPLSITQANGIERFPSFTLQFYEDQRDYKAFPLSGWKYQIFGRIAGGPSALASTNFGKLGATWAHHLPIGGRRLNFAYGLQQIVSIGDRIPFFTKSFLGINRSEFSGVSTNLRGYEPFALATTYMSVVKTEWKYALYPRQILHFDEIPYPRFQDLQFGLYLSAFLDGAYLRDDAFNRADQYLKNQLLYSYGLGLNMIGFYDILLRVEYSRNHLQQAGLYLHADLQIK